MFNTEKKLRERIITLENQVEILITEKDMEATKALKEFKSVTDKIEHLEKEKKRLTNEVEDLEAKSVREDENIKHKVKIVMEKNTLELQKEKQTILATKDKEVGLLKDTYRDKREKQLEEQSKDLKDMYVNVLDKLTKVTGTLSQPQQMVSDNGASK